MSLNPGARLSSYEIVALLGVGGMGEVYRARDTTLDRDVALKVLPELFTTDPERRGRFEREAKLLATLNHPNIAQVYGAGVSGHAFIAMELIEGEDLSAHIARGPLPVQQALAYARQIAAALETAHDQGIVHRDLKPGNVKVREDGAVKVLDFGLAKALAVDAEAAAASVSNSPTLTARSTQLGMILGTAAYMAPEQAKGRAVDRRADVWAFGVVLFEMLTGRRVFNGEDVSEVLASVLKTDPDWTSLPADLPAPVRRLLQRCLEKDPKKRLRDVSEGVIQMDDALAGGLSSGLITAETTARRPWWSRPLVVAAATAVVAAAAVYVAGKATAPAAAPSESVRFSFNPSPALNVTPMYRDFAISPDGRLIVFSAIAAQTPPMLYVRRLDEFDVAVIRGTEGAYGPFFSPNGQWIGFVDSSDRTTVRKVPLTGGPPTTIGKASTPLAGAAWLTDGTIVLGAAGSPLLRVSENGGTPVPIVGPDPKGPGFLEHLFPSAVPGTNVIVFLSNALNRQPMNAARLAAIDLTTQRIVTSTIQGGQPSYLDPGHVLYPGADGSLRAVGFDAGTMTFSSNPVPVLEGVGVKTSGGANFAVASNGALVYSSGTPILAMRTLVWADRTGKATPITAPARNYYYARVSPDGKRLSLDVRDQEEDIWIWNLARGNLSRLTDKDGPDQYGLWTPNGEQIVFASIGGDRIEIFWHRPDAVGTPEQITDTAAEGLTPFPNAITTDGKQVILRSLVRRGTASMQNDLFLVDIKGDRKVKPLLSTEHEELNAALSPDGKYMAFESDQSGTFEIYVRPFPDVNSRQWPVSTAGGAEAVWSHNGREIFYISPDAKMMAVRVTTSPSFELGKPEELFDVKPYYFGGLGRNYDVAKDGRFVLVKNGNAASTNTTINVVLNWVGAIADKLRTPTK